MYIFSARALASCRRRPLSSNVRLHKQPYSGSASFAKSVLSAVGPPACKPVSFQLVGCWRFAPACSAPRSQSLRPPKAAPRTAAPVRRPPRLPAVRRFCRSVAGTAMNRKTCGLCTCSHRLLVSAGPGPVPCHPSPLHSAAPAAARTQPGSTAPSWHTCGHGFAASTSTSLVTCSACRAA